MPEGTGTPEITVLLDMYGSPLDVDTFAREHGIDPSDETALASAAEDERLELKREERIDASAIDDEGIEWGSALDMLQGSDPGRFREVTVRDFGEGPFVEVSLSERLELDMSDDEMTHYQSVIEDVLREKLDAEISGESWDQVDVTLYRKLDPEKISDSYVCQAAYDVSAEWTNQTDRGTYGSPWIGNEINERIENTRVANFSDRYAAHSIDPDLIDTSQERISDREAVALSADLATRHGAEIGSLYRDGRMDVLSTNAILVDIRRNTTDPLEHRKLDAFASWIDQPVSFEESD